MTCPRFLALCAALLSACATPVPNETAPAQAQAAFERTRIDAALLSGRNQASPCRAQIEHDADEFFDCIRVRSRSGFGDLGLDPKLEDARRLGVLFYGWYSADLDAAYALEGARAAADRLLVEAMELQERLALADESLCLLVEAPCAGILSRLAEARAELAGAGGKAGQ